MRRVYPGPRIDSQLKVRGMAILLMLRISELPQNHLSRFIEERVNRFMNGSAPESAEKCEVIIRTLAVYDKEMEVKPHMRHRLDRLKGSTNSILRYGPKGYPDKFNYRTKCVFAFEVVDGIEVCFFGLHVQEFGNDCPAPNRG